MVRMLKGAAALGALLAVLVGALLTAATPASAHAVVVGSDPSDGQRLAMAPATVTIRFDESVGLALGYLHVVDTAGQRVDVGNASHPTGQGSAISVALKSGLRDGSYLASFRVVSADSHVVGGSIRFVVGNGPLGLASEPSATTRIDPGVAVGLATSHWLSFAGVAAVGGSWLIFSIWPSGRRRRAIRGAVWAGWTLAAAGALGEFGLQGPYASGTGLSGVVRPTLLDATLHVNSGQLLSLRLLLLGVLGLVLAALLGEDESRRPSWGPEAAAIVGVGIVVTYAASGHSQSANPRWLAIVVDALHLSAMVVWLGGLTLLLVAALSRARPDMGEEPGSAADSDAAELAAGLPIFSRIALGCVATLAVTGIVQAWREVGTLHALPATWYGRLVVVKALLLGGLIVLGYFARRLVQRRDWRRGPLQRMRRTILVEVLVGAVVLGVTGVLIAQPPGKVALAAVRAKPKSVTVAVSRNDSARVEVTPGVHGSVQVVIELAGPDAPRQVTASAAMPAKSLGPIALALQPSGPRSYTSNEVVLPSAGDWQISLVVQTSAFDATTAVARIDLS